LRPQHYLVLNGYDPRIHTLYFCPQLYRFDDENKLVGLEGGEIGRLVAYFLPHSLAAVRCIGITDKHADARRVLNWNRR
jgi:hypothetical protein